MRHPQRYPIMEKLCGWVGGEGGVGVGWLARKAWSLPKFFPDNARHEVFQGVKRALLHTSCRRCADRVASHQDVKKSARPKSEVPMPFFMVLIEATLL